MDAAFADLGPAQSGSDFLVATGTSQVAAARITAKFNLFRTVAPGTGCMLPASAAVGTAEIVIMNADSNALLVYPPPGGFINTPVPNLPVSLAAGDVGWFFSFQPAVGLPGMLWYGGGIKALISWASPGTIGSSTPNTGVFTTLQGTDYIVAGAAAATAAATYIRGAEATGRALVFQTATSNRWSIGATNTAEAGGNAGSNLVVESWSDAGVSLGTPLVITRATGAVQVAAVTIPPTLVDAINDAAAQAAGVAVGEAYRNGSVLMVRVA